MKGTKVYMTPGQAVSVIGCYSEALCHAGMAGRPVDVLVIEWKDRDGKSWFSGAYIRPSDGYSMTGFTLSECGIYSEFASDGSVRHYTYQRDPADTGDVNPELLIQEITTDLLKAITS